jgi:hypothetical protein
MRKLFRNVNSCENAIRFEPLVNAVAVPFSGEFDEELMYLGRLGLSMSQSDTICLSEWINDPTKSSFPTQIRHTSVLADSCAT